MTQNAARTAGLAMAALVAVLLTNPPLSIAGSEPQAGQHGAAIGTTIQVPTLAGKALLFRYPYIQTDSPRRMTILWGTTRSGHGEVKFRRKGSGSWATAKSIEEKYPTSRTQLPRDFYKHVAHIDDLPADTEFEYQTSLDGVVLAQGIPFKTLPEIGSESVAFVAMGDFGTKYSTPLRVRDAVVKGATTNRWQYPHDFVVGVGDIAYYNGSYAEFEQNFFGQMSGKNDLGDGRQSLLSRRPFVAVLGNHEYTSDNERSVPEGFLESFSKPASADVPPEQQGRYYSFDSGPAHFVVLDSMRFQGNQTSDRHDMINWLDRDLSATKQKWRIVFLHHATYAHGPHGTWGDTATNRRLRADLVPVLQKHGVQLVLNGHDHLYERTVPLTVDASSHIIRERGCRIVDSPNGIIFLTVGNGGDDLHGRGADNAPCGTDSFNQAMREYGEGYDFAATRNGHAVIIDERNRNPEVPAIRHGFTYVKVSGSRISIKALNLEGRLLDEFDIQQ
jgi:hypothetical protein